MWKNKIHVFYICAEKRPEKLYSQIITMTYVTFAVSAQESPIYNPALSQEKDKALPSPPVFQFFQAFPDIR